MSIFSSVGEHDLEFEYNLMRDKFISTGGNDRDGNWTIVELRPKGDDNDYKGCSILHISRVVDYFRSECYQSREYEYSFLVDFIKHEIERYGIRIINYPWKKGWMDENHEVKNGTFEMVPLYVIPRPFWYTMTIDFIAMNRPWTESHTSFTKDC